MRITAAETVPVRVPFSHPGPPTGFGGETWTDLAFLLVRVETDEGITGWGEAFGYNCIPATRAAFETMVAPQAVGRDADDIGALMRDLFLKLHIFGRYGVTVFALSGLEIALWDIAGKKAGKPLHELVGGARAKSLPCYGSLLKYDDPEVTARVAAAALGDGYARIKLHENAEAPVAAARAALGPDVPMMLDVNCSWGADDMPGLRKWILDADLLWLEEPTWPPENYDLLAKLRGDGFRIATGENLCTAWQFRELLKAGAADFAQPSVTKVGGVAEFVAVADEAGRAGVPLGPHSPYFGPGFLATMHLIAARAPDAFVERLYVDLEADLFGGVTVPRDGRVTLPDGPGLGIDPDPELLRRWRAD